MSFEKTLDKRAIYQQISESSLIALKNFELVLTKSTLFMKLRNNSWMIVKFTLHAYCIVKQVSLFLYPIT